ncbi:MAG: NAD(P)/FAD-dependent oxidoreductase [Candidatus Sumerlaeota bacterium]|nr:NAD(P)/FAD-dependent oxidoreductase [Candidatus Sumerlaeota bacterium]
MASSTPSDSFPVLVLGAGPAGLAAAYELAKAGRSVTVLEKSDHVGGLAATVEREGNRFDIGGHRFFTTNAEVWSLWEEMLGGSFLRVNRASRIYYGGRFFHYPLRPLEALARLGPWTAAAILASYLRQKIHPYQRPETLEQWVCNKFGRRLYEIFFRPYTEKVWGVPCSEISAQWAAQRIKGLSVGALLGNMFSLDSRRGAKSLIECFHYPRKGPGQLYEALRAFIEDKGHRVALEREAQAIEHDGRGRVGAVVVDTPDGPERIEAAAVLSSIPIHELVLRLSPPAPPDVQDAARRLRYRDFLVVNLVLNRESVFPDQWLYIHEPSTRVARIQNYKNWSAGMIADPRRTTLGMEYFCTRGDDLWNARDEALVALAASELDRIGLARAADVVEGFVARRAHAYCLHDTAHKQSLKTVKRHLAGFANLQTMGRAGMFKYNNQDHSILTGLLAARNVLGARHDLWSVNIDAEYPG